MNRKYSLFLLTMIATVSVACGPVAQTSNEDEIVARVLATVQAQEQTTISLEEGAEIKNVNVQTSSPMVQNDMQDALTSLYDRVNPSVVFIGDKDSPSAGSGFVYDDLGHIVTNYHVVESINRVLVRFSNGEQRDATVVGVDIDSDLAVIRVDSVPSNIYPVPLAPKAEIDVGQFVVAIGNPFGEEGSMTLGIVSALGRGLRSQRQLSAYGGGSYQLPQVIQTDAPINPGNSGGPLLNLKGEVVGVNAAILSPTVATGTPSNSGVGFSIPVDAVHIIVPELIANGRYVYPFMGISFGTLTADAAAEEGLSSQVETYVSNLTVNGPGMLAGLQLEDIIIQLDDTIIQDFNDLNAYLTFNSRPGQVINVTIVRDGMQLVLPLTLGERP